MKDFDEGKKKLFEHQQMMLETNTDALHEQIEIELKNHMDPEELDRSKFYKYRADVTNKTSIVSDFYTKFIASLDN